MWLVSFITFYSFWLFLFIVVAAAAMLCPYSTGCTLNVIMLRLFIAIVHCVSVSVWCEAKTFYCRITLQKHWCVFNSSNPITSTIFPIGISQPNRQTCRFTQFEYSHTERGHCVPFAVHTQWAQCHLGHVCMYVYKTAKSQRNLAKSPAHHQTITIDNCLSLSLSFSLSVYDINQYGHLTGHSAHIYTIYPPNGMAIVHRCNSNVPFTWQQFTVMISNFICIFILFIRFSSSGLM